MITSQVLHPEKNVEKTSGCYLLGVGSSLLAGAAAAATQTS
jgi:hypothetical protein